MRISILLFILISLLSFMTACSSDQRNPVEPSGQQGLPDFPSVDISQNPENHNLTGMWTMCFDPEELDLSIESTRQAGLRWDVTPLIPFPAFEIVIFDPLTGLLEVNATVTNPTSLSAYDLRFIVYTDDLGSRLKNADDWTSMFDIPGGAQINPFKAYAKDIEMREFTGNDTQHTQRLQLYFPAGVTMLDFAITASWPENTDEPYQIKNFWQNDLYDTVGHSAQIEVSVYDWQDDVNSVQLWCPSITGEPMVLFSKLSALRWQLELVNNTGASPGVYTGSIIATSQNSGPVALYDIVDITVQPTPAVGGNAVAWGGTKKDYGNAVVLDDDKNMYVAGVFEDICDFHPGFQEENRTSNGETDVFIVKYDQEWNLHWVRTWGGEYADLVYETGVDSDGYLYVVGTFIDTVDFDPGPGKEEHTSGSTEARNTFLSRFNTNGELDWVLTWGNLDVNNGGYDLSIDNNDNIYVTGMYTGSVDFDPGSGMDIHSSFGNTPDSYLSRFTKNGDYVWALTWGGGGQEYGYTLDNDIDGNTYVSGIFQGTTDFDPDSGIAVETSAGYYDVYLTKFDPVGVFQWVRAFGGESLEVAEKIMAYESSAIYIAGYFYYTTDLDPGTGVAEYTSNGYSDAFLSKLDSSGTYEWGYAWGGTGDEGDVCTSIALDDINVYVTGGYMDVVDFDPTDGEDIHTSNKWFRNFFLTAYSHDGTYEWTNSWGGIYQDTSLSMELNDGTFYLTGYYGQTVDFDPDTGGLDEYTAAGYLDAFLLRYNH